MSTEGRDYAERLRAMQDVWWKRALDVQRPYRANLHRQHLGVTLDIGCGIGRQLSWLPPGSVGVDHNSHSVAVARQRGLAAYATGDFLASELASPGAFDSLLLAHVVEHMEREEALEVIRSYLPYLRPGGRLMLICPQEVGFRSDPTHVRFFDGPDLAALARDLGLEPGMPWSFPFPRWAGKVFVYNETNLVATLPAPEPASGPDGR
ncbi:MAG: class I SAM-dependent methyltransferase [Dermatophilaceae bacterium]